MQASKRTNIHIYPSDGSHESRVFRSCEWAKRSGLYSNIIFYVLGNRVRDSEHYDNYSVSKIASSKLGYIAALFIKLSRTNLTINVHNWYLLLPALYSYFFFKNRLIYEPHEVEFGTSYISPLGKKLCFLLERLFFSLKGRSASVFVGICVKTEYEKLYNIKNGFLVRSLPQVIEGEISCESIDSDLQTGCYVGLFTFGRGIDIYLKLLDEGLLKRFIFIGHGPMLDELKSASKSNSKIQVVDSLDEGALYTFLTKTRPICFSLMDIKSLSNRCASPNKFFTYLAAQCPIVYSDFGDQAIIAKDLSAGVGVKEIEFNNLSENLKNLQQSFKTYQLPADYFKGETCMNYLAIHRGIV